MGLNAHGNTARQAMDRLWTEARGRHKQSNDPRNHQHHPQYPNYWAPLTRKRHIPPHPAQPQHTNRWAPRTQKRHQQEHRPQRPTERNDPTQHAKGRTGDCPGPRKGTTTRRNVTRGGGGGSEDERTITKLLSAPNPPNFFLRPKSDPKSGKKNFVRPITFFKGQKWSTLAKIGRPNFIVISSPGDGGVAPHSPISIPARGRSTCSGSALGRAVRRPPTRGPNGALATDRPAAAPHPRRPPLRRC